MAALEISKNGMELLRRRYLSKNEKGEITETAEAMFRRVANAVASAESKFGGDENAAADAFYDLMTGLRFLPNSPTLMNAGRPLGQLSACFVLPVEDSMEAIFDAVKDAALIHKSGGGTGFSFSRLRPAGAVVKTTGGVASGPVSFMRVFNMATEAVKQGGTRRGANMGILRVDHPDIEQFIRCKADNADITNFNISVGLTEAFMKAAQKGEDYDLIDPITKKPCGRKNARALFDEIVDAAWHNGEPGILFLDRINRDNPVPAQGPIESTNPCGEQPLLPYESCNLGSVNLARMVAQGDTGAQIDWDGLRETVKTAVRFLDDVIEVNHYPLPRIAQTTLLTRKIGLGVMGFADMLLKLGVPYNSEEGVELGGKVMAFIQAEGRKASEALAAERGAFPLFDQSIYKDGAPLRNATVTTIAPTGSISMIAGASSGIEPVFAFAYIRNVLDNTQFVEVDPVFEAAIRARGLHSEDLMRRLAKEGTIQHMDDLPEDMKRVFVCAHDVDPVWHVRMQAAFQHGTDNAVSKTVNFPHDATREQVANVYRLAYAQGLKGVTIYRDGSRDSQVLNIGKVSGAKENEPAAPASVTPRPRPAITRGFTERVRIGCGNLYVTVNYDENGICEVFTSTGKAGGCPSQSEATARLASVALRSGLSVKEIYDQLKGIRCPSTIRQQGMGCTSCPDGIARVLLKVEKFIEQGQAPTADPLPKSDKAASGHHGAQMKYCPDCGGELLHEGGCVICRNCGFSKCS